MFAVPPCGGEDYTSLSLWHLAWPCGLFWPVKYKQNWCLEWPLWGSQAWRPFFLFPISCRQDPSLHDLLWVPMGRIKQLLIKGGTAMKAPESESRSVVSDSLWPHGLYNPWNSPGQNTGVGTCSLLQGIFPTQESNAGLPHCRRIPFQLSHKRSPRILE